MDGVHVVVVAGLFAAVLWASGGLPYGIVAPGETPAGGMYGTGAAAMPARVIPGGADAPGAVHDTSAGYDTTAETARPPYTKQNAEAQKRYVLELVNSERVAAGLDMVEYGNNTAAQIHADDMLAKCYASHWGSDGLKPYMRYSLTGGYQGNAEIVSGLNYCMGPRDGHDVVSLRLDIGEMVDGFMNGTNHRDVVLDPRHTSVNLGIAWDQYNTRMVLHFEYGYVSFAEPPHIWNGTLSFNGTLLNGAGSRWDMVVVQMFHDPPPHPLTAGQLARTYGYGYGIPVDYYRPEPPQCMAYGTGNVYVTIKGYHDPYGVSPDVPAPESISEAHQMYQLARGYPPPFYRENMWAHTYDTYSKSGDIIHVETRVQSSLNRNGPGVYTIVVWADVDGTMVNVAERSVFHGVTPPHMGTPVEIRLIGATYHVGVVPMLSLTFNESVVLVDVDKITLHGGRGVGSLNVTGEPEGNTVWFALSGMSELPPTMVSVGSGAVAVGDIHNGFLYAGVVPDG